MTGRQSGEDVLQYSNLLKGSEAKPRKSVRRLLSPYSTALFVHDFVLIALSFLFGACVAGVRVQACLSLDQLLILGIISLVALSFFPNYSLYSYHVIFQRRAHVKNMAKALGWGMGTLAVTILVVERPELLEQGSILIFILAASLVLLFLSRFFGDQLLNLPKAMGLAFVAIGLIDLIGAGEITGLLESRRGLFIGFLVALGVVSVSRYLLVHVVFNEWLRRRFRRQVAIIGAGSEAKRITNHVIDKNAPYWVAGYVSDREAAIVDRPVVKSRLGGLAEFPSILEEGNIEEIIVTDVNMDQRILISLVDFCTSMGVTVWFPPTLLPIVDLKLRIDTFCGLPMIRVGEQKHADFFNKIKHGFDALLTLPLALLLVPIFAVIAMAIKLDSPGPVFYRATAVGRNGRTFGMYKFRSMRTDADSENHKEYVTRLIKGKIKEDSGNGVFKIEKDPRITRVGALLRKFSLDELPQIINVLKGDMSLVGPRPCLPYEYEIYKDWHKKRLSIRPGITGIWQVAGRSAVSFEDMVLLDLYYIYNRTLLLDLNILYETVFAVLGKRGAY